MKKIIKRHSHALLLAVLLAVLSRAPAFAQDSPASTRAGVMAQACVATGGTRCQAVVTEALAKGQSFAMVTLLGCQAELNTAAPLGPDAIAAAEEKASACIAAAVHSSKGLSSDELLAAPRSTSKAATPLSGPNADATVRAKLTQTDGTCSAIKYPRARYNCYRRSVTALVPQKQ